MKIVDKILETVLSLLVAVMVLGCVWQVFTRFALNSPSKYTEELLRYLLIWTTMLGVPYAYGKDKHLSINLLTTAFTEKGKFYAQLATRILIVILSITVMIIGGYMVTTNAAGQISPALQLPMEVYYACVPISGILMLVYSADHLIKMAATWKEVQ